MSQADFTPNAEQWKSIPGWEGLYEASDRGRVRSVDRFIAKSNGITQQNKGRILRTQNHNAGYAQYTLSRNGKTETHLAHHLIATTFIGPRPDGHEVNHKDTNKHNNRADNLEYVTAIENVRHAARLGVNAVLDRHGRAILTIEQAEFVHARLAEFSGRGACVAIARELGVKPCIIYEIKYGNNWTKEAIAHAKATRPSSVSPLPG